MRIFRIDCVPCALETGFYKGFCRLAPTLINEVETPQSIVQVLVSHHYLTKPGIVY